MKAYNSYFYVHIKFIQYDLFFHNIFFEIFHHALQFCIFYIKCDFIYFFSRFWVCGWLLWITRWNLCLNIFPTTTRTSSDNSFSGQFICDTSTRSFFFLLFIFYTFSPKPYKIYKVFFFPSLKPYLLFYPPSSTFFSLFCFIFLFYYFFPFLRNHIRFRFSFSTIISLFFQCSTIKLNLKIRRQAGILFTRGNEMNIKLSLLKKPGDISLIEMFNPNLYKNKSYYLNFNLLYEI